MNKRENIMIIFGGNSPEHEVSLRSAASVYRFLDKELFCPIPVAITRSGRFVELMPPEEESPFRISPETVIGSPLSFTPGEPPLVNGKRIDFVFPIAHGAYGEDGRLQGFLEMTSLPYAGCRTVGSAVCMDKELTKQLCHADGIPVVPFKLLRSPAEASAAAEEIGYPLVIKPVNAGSSCGVSKVKTPELLETAVNEAFRFDSKVLIEKWIEARELECAVIGNNPFTVFPPGEIVSDHEFYDYNSKYIDSASASLKTKASLPKEISEAIRNYAARAAERCEVCGFARIDFFMDKQTGDVYLNEINTLPGFTAGSLFPLMCRDNGIPITQVLTQIIRLGQQTSSAGIKFESSAE